MFRSSPAERQLWLCGLHDPHLAWRLEKAFAWAASEGIKTFRQVAAAAGDEIFNRQVAARFTNTFLDLGWLAPNLT